MYSPTYQGPIEGYVMNYLRRNFWKVRNFMEFEDASQEAALVFSSLVQAYPEMDTPQHFMALFKTSWHRHFTDLANKDTVSRVVCFEHGAPIQQEDEPTQLDVQGSPDNEALILLAIKQAPEEVRQVLSLFLNAPIELLQLATDTWKRQGRYKAEGNQMVSRMLGMPQNSEPLDRVYQYFLE